VDKLTKEEVLPVISGYADCYKFAAIIPISALEELNLDQLVTAVKQYCQSGPQFYPEDMVTDQPEKIVMAELIREKVLQLTREEVPHAIAVEIEDMAARPNDTVYVRAVIYVERDSQKGIIIGAGGSLLKEIGRLARADIENLLGSKIYLDLWVKVKKDWRNRAGVLRSLGYDAKLNN
jgi:GTP-binding protein Era